MNICNLRTLNSCHILPLIVVIAFFSHQEGRIGWKRFLLQFWPVHPLLWSSPEPSYLLWTQTSWALDEYQPLQVDCQFNCENKIKQKLLINSENLSVKHCILNRASASHCTHHLSKFFTVSEYNTDLSVTQLPYLKLLKQVRLNEWQMNYIKLNGMNKCIMYYLIFF